MKIVTSYYKVVLVMVAALFLFAACDSDKIEEGDTYNITPENPVINPCDGNVAPALGVSERVNVPVIYLQASIRDDYGIPAEIPDGAMIASTILAYTATDEDGDTLTPSVTVAEETGLTVMMVQEDEGLRIGITGLGGEDLGQEITATLRVTDQCGAFTEKAVTLVLAPEVIEPDVCEDTTEADFHLEGDNNRVLVIENFLDYLPEGATDVRFVHGAQTPNAWDYTLGTPVEPDECGTVRINLIEEGFPLQNGESIGYGFRGVLENGEEAWLETGRLNEVDGGEIVTISTNGDELLIMYVVANAFELKSLEEYKANAVLEDGVLTITNASAIIKFAPGDEILLVAPDLNWWADGAGLEAEIDENNTLRVDMNGVFSPGDHAFNLKNLSHYNIWFRVGGLNRESFIDMIREFGPSYQDADYIGSKIPAIHVNADGTIEWCAEEARPNN